MFIIDKIYFSGDVDNFNIGEYNNILIKNRGSGQIEIKLDDISLMVEGYEQFLFRCIKINNIKVKGINTTRLLICCW